MKLKIGLIHENEIKCIYRTHVFGGWSNYINVIVLCGSLNNETLSMEKLFEG